MSILRKKRYSGSDSDGTNIVNVKDKIHGSCEFRLNKKKTFFTNDYTYLYANELDDDGENTYDGEIGVNKAKYKAHDNSWFDELKDQPFFRRSEEGDDNIHPVFDVDINELLDILEDIQADEENS